MKYIKAYERMGVEKIVVEIVEKLFQEFLKHFKKEKAFTDQVDKFNVDIKEFNLYITNLAVEIYYNQSFSSILSSRIKIGVLNRKNDKIKTLEELKEEILHEIKHLIYRLREKQGERDNIFNSDGVGKLIQKDIFGAFSNKQGNLYNLNVTLANFLKYDKLSDNYKKLIVYLYLSESDELEARLHQVYNKAKNTNNFEEMLKKEEESGNVGIRFYKDMINFKINIDEFSDYEKENFYKLLSNKSKAVKNISNYINKQGEKFIKKLHKMSYFQGTDHTIFNTE